MDPLPSIAPLPNQSSFEKMYMWVREHPLAMKVMQVAGLILGIGLIAGAAVASSFFGLGFITLAIPGVLLTLVSTIALLSLEILVPPHHDMKHHVFKPGQCEGGRLYYEGDVPILSLDTDDPTKAGMAHGYLCGDAINRLFKRFGFVLKILGRQPQKSKMTETIDTLRKVIPEDFLKEIEGLAEGYNKWAKENPKKLPKKLTGDDILLFHLMPEYLHFQTKNFKNKGNLGLACSAIVDIEPEKGVVFARNMDWPSLKLGGKLSLIIHRRATDCRFGTVGVGAPSLIGQVTGMNDQGLALAMNVCSGKTKKIRGMPSVFYNRTCLEQCRTIQDVEAFTEKQAPLGPYHLTAADEKGAKSIHFYQGDNKSHYLREGQENQPLSTLNCRYSPHKPPYSPRHYSIQRQKHIDHFFKHRGGRPLEEVLTLPFVNNFITTHRVVMEPKTRTFKVGFDNAFAGKVPLQEVFVNRLFKEGST